MKTTIKFDRILDLTSALHFITSDTADIRHIRPILTQRGTHVFRPDNLDDLAVYFTEVHIVVDEDGYGELVLFWANGVIENVVSAIEHAIED